MIKHYKGDVILGDQSRMFFHTKIDRFRMWVFFTQKTHKKNHSFFDKMSMIRFLAKTSSGRKDNHRAEGTCNNTTEGQIGN